MIIGKLYNSECAIYFKKIDAGGINCSNINDTNCQNFANNIFEVDDYAYSRWSGFSGVGEADYDVETSISGKQLITNTNFKSKELNIAFRVCLCDCDNDVLNCLFSKCCNYSDTFFEFLDDCGNIYKIRVALRNLLIENDDEFSNCQYINIEMDELRSDYIYKATAAIEYPAYLAKNGVTEICSCKNNCVSKNNWNSTKEVCFESQNYSIIIETNEPLDNFTLLWNSIAYTINLIVEKGDIVEIRDGVIFKNNFKVGELGDYGIIIKSQNCVSVQTFEKKATFKVLEYNKILNCKNEIWRL